MHARHFLFVALSTLVAACGLETSTTEQGLVACPNWACAQNNATLNNRIFHELAEDGTANAEGFQLGPMVKNGVTFQVKVVGTRLVGSNSASTLSGSALVGAYFYIIDANHQAIRVYIKGLMPVPVWAGPKKGTMLESYRLEWTDPSADRIQNLCATPPVEKPLSSELLGQDAEYTMVFEGTRYQAEKKLVLPGDRNWFNIACAGHSLSKLLLTGHQLQTGNASVAQQQAVLKMLVADYCGDGTPFTVGGEPLYWKSADGYMSFFGTPKTLEARWSDKGAVCLGQPRLKVTKLAIAQQTYPDIYAAIEAQCPQAMPPQCLDTDLANFDGQLAVSGNPLGE